MSSHPPPPPTTPTPRSSTSTSGTLRRNPPPIFYPNDIIGRVLPPSSAGAGIFVGVVEYPTTNTTHSDLLSILSSGEGYGGGQGGNKEFIVTWIHYSGHPSNKYAFREFINPNKDPSIFVIDREFVEGSYVRRVGEGGSLGVVKGVQSLITIALFPTPTPTQGQESRSSIPSPQQMIIDLHPGNIQPKTMLETGYLGDFFLLGTWIGQVVEVSRRVTLFWEHHSELEVSYRQTLGDKKKWRRNCEEGDEGTLAQRLSSLTSLGEEIVLSSMELSGLGRGRSGSGGGVISSSWISTPPGRAGLLWPLLRPFRYGGQRAVLSDIKIEKVLLEWVYPLLSPVPSTPLPPKRNWSGLEIASLLKSGALAPLQLPLLPSDIQLGDSISVLDPPPPTATPTPNSGIERASYVTWANNHLKDIKTQWNRLLDSSEGGPPPPKRSREADPEETMVQTPPPSQFLLLSGGYSQPDPEAPVSSLSKGRVTLKRSLVTVEWADGHLESLPSPSLVPVLLSPALVHPIGAILKIREEESPFIFKDAEFYAIVVQSASDTYGAGGSGRVRLNHFRIPPGSPEPVLVAKDISLPNSRLLPHPIYSFAPGDILVRSSPYETSFSAGIFIKGMPTGQLLLLTSTTTTGTTPTQFHTWPNRVMKMGRRAWRGGRVAPCPPVSAFHRNLGLDNLTPSNSVFAFSPHTPFQGHSITVIDEGYESHHYYRDHGVGGQGPTPPPPFEEGKIVRLLELEVAALITLPKGIWVKALAARKDLLFMGMEGPPRTLYEDVLLFLHIRLPPSWPSSDAPDIFHESFFSYDLNPFLKKNGQVRFHPRGRLGQGQGHGQPPKFPNLGPFFLDIYEISLKCSPLERPQGKLSRFAAVALPFLPVSSTPREIFAEALIEIVQVIGRQLLNPPPVWRSEVLFYYSIHIPKFCGRVSRWALGTCGENELPPFPLLPMTPPTRDKMLENLSQLMELYNTIF